MFGNGQWKVVKGNLAVACGKKMGSLYMVDMSSKGVDLFLVKDKVRFTESRGQKKVRFASNKPRARVKIQDERARKVKSVGGHRDSGITGRVSVTVLGRQWIKKTNIPAVKVSPANYLLNMESVCSQSISGSGSLFQWEPVGTENRSGVVLAVTDVLELRGASTGLQVN